MNRVDFYRVMNIDYMSESQYFTVTSEGNFTVDALVGLAVAYGTAQYSLLVGYGIGLGAGAAVDQFLFEPGDYRVEFILGEIYNYSLDAYETIITASYYKLGIDVEGNPNEQFVESITKYGGTFEESLVK